MNYRNNYIIIQPMELQDRAAVAWDKYLAAAAEDVTLITEAFNEGDEPKLREIGATLVRLMADHPDKDRLRMQFAIAIEKMMAPYVAQWVEDNASNDVPDEADEKNERELVAEQ